MVADERKRGQACESGRAKRNRVEQASSLLFQNEQQAGNLRHLDRNLRFLREERMAAAPDSAEVSPDRTAGILHLREAPPAINWAR